MALFIPNMYSSEVQSGTRTVTLTWPRHYASFYGGDANWWSDDPTYDYCLFAAEWPSLRNGYTTKLSDTYIKHSKVTMCTIQDNTTVNEAVISAGSLSLTNIPIGSIIVFTVICEDWYNSNNGQSMCLLPIVSASVTNTRWFAWHSEDATYIMPTLTITNCTPRVDLGNVYNSPPQICQDKVPRPFTSTIRALTWAVI